MSVDTSVAAVAGRPRACTTSNWGWGAGGGGVGVCMLFCLGIVTGNPRVFQGYPDPDPVRTRTRPLGTGFAGYGYGYPSGHTDMRWVGSMGWVRMYQAGKAGIKRVR